MNEDYDHSDKIGNEGDVVKHAILCKLVEALLDQKKGEPFVYAESHTGAPAYTLPGGGRWVNGIGAFSKSLYREQAHDAVDLDLRYPNLAAYRNACFSEPAKVDSVYYGSSGIVFRMILRTERAFEFRLWDSNTDVCHKLLKFYQEFPQVLVCKADGYQGLKSLGTASLALIDPISIQDDRALILTCMAHLSERDIPFLCWTPLFGDDHPIYDEFDKETRESYATVRITWPLIEGGTWGCLVTTPVLYDRILRNTTKEVCAVMKWEY